MSNIKERVLTLCLERNVKVGTLERMANMSNGTISKWTSSTIPNGATLQTIADFFNVSVDYLLGRSSDADIPSGQATQYAEVIQKKLIENGTEGMEDVLYPILFEEDKSVAEPKRLSANLEKSVKKQQEYDADFRTMVDIRRFVARLLAKLTKKEFPPDVYESYLKFEIGLEDLWDPSNPRAKERMEAARQREQHKWGNISDPQPENSPALPASPELQAMIEKMVEEQVKKQLQEANADVGRAKKVE